MFRMARVSLIPEADRGPPNDTGQQLDLAQILRATAKTPLDFAGELLLHELRDGAYVRIVAGEGEV
eukprot:6861227-Alexandrium_andersonii.AAC.1